MPPTPLKPKWLARPYLVIWLYVHHHEDKNEYEIDYHHPDRPIEALDIASSNALREEDAVVIIVVHADVTVLAVLHVLGDVDVAFDAVEDPVLFAF